MPLDRRFAVGKRIESDLFRQVVEQVVRMCIQAGLVGSGHRSGNRFSAARMAASIEEKNSIKTSFGPSNRVPAISRDRRMPSKQRIFCRLASAFLIFSLTETYLFRHGLRLMVCACCRADTEPSVVSRIGKFGTVVRLKTALEHL